MQLRLRRVVSVLPGLTLSLEPHCAHVVPLEQILKRDLDRANRVLRESIPLMANVFCARVSLSA